MEWPRTTLASTAGVRSGYGLGIFSTITLPYHVLGHNGGIDGFLSAYGYSPSRDVGYVVLLNSTHSPAALTRLTSLAIRYLKREVEPPPKPTLAATRDELQQFAGYYRDTSPRNAILAGAQFLRDGRTIAVEGDRLVLTPDFGPSTPLVPVNPGLFRREREIDASLAFTTTEDGTRLLTGPGIYATLAPRWPIVAAARRAAGGSDGRRAGAAGGAGPVVPTTAPQRRCVARSRGSARSGWLPPPR